MQRSILITGCSSGIGRASALAMARRGWRVFATARTPEDLDALEAEGLEAVPLDYTEADTVQACAERVLAATGGALTALFNNGAYGQPGAVEDLRPDVLRRQFEANFFGWHDLTWRLLPCMLERGQGRIVHCSSVLGLVGLKYRGAYVASKFALEGLTDCLRLELRGSGVSVSLIEPGPIRTRFTEHALQALIDNVDMEGSRLREVYARRVRRLGKGGTDRFKLEPEAVARRLIHAVESPRPRARYYVTTPTYLLGGLKRLLPTAALDGAAARISDGE